MRLTATSRWLLGVLVVDALLVWAVLELSTSTDGVVVLLIQIVVSVGLTWWQTFRTPQMRWERELTARALTDHRDPGPQHRAAVEARAHEWTASSRLTLRLGTGLLLVSVAGGAVVAVLRDEAGAAPPLAGLLLATFGVRRWALRRHLAASRWLDDPPYEQERA